MLLYDLQAKASVDRHLADQLILFAGLAEGFTEYIIPRMTEHVDTNLWLIEKILGATVAIEGKTVRIKGVGFSK